MEKKILSSVEKRKRITFTMIITFSILLAMTSGIGDFLTRNLFQLVTFVGQIIVVKALLDDFYREE